MRFINIDGFNTKVWEHKRMRLLNALVKGFKTRLLLHPAGYHKVLHQIKLDILRATNQEDGSKAMIIDVNDRLTLKNLMKRRR